MNSGANQPSTPYAYQLWYDTTTDILKIRDSSNGAWLDLFTFNQSTNTVTAVAGSEDPTAIAITL